MFCRSLYVLFLSLYCLFFYTRCHRSLFVILSLWSLHCLLYTMSQIIVCHFFLFGQWSVLLYTMSADYPFENIQSFLVSYIPCRDMFTSTWHKVCKWLMTAQWFSLSASDSTTNYNWLLQYNWIIVEAHNQYLLTILLYCELHTWNPAGIVMIFLFNSK